MSKPDARWKSFTWWLAIAAFILLAIPAGVFLLLTSRPGEALIRQVAERRLEAALDRPIAIGRLRTNLFTSLRLSDVRVGAPGAARGTEPALRLGSARVEYRLLPLLRGEVRIGLLELRDVDLDTAALPAPGRAPAPAPPPVPVGFAPLPVRIDRLLVESAHIRTPGGEVQVDQAEIGPVVGTPASLSIERLLLRLPGTELTGRAAARGDGGRTALQGRLEVRGNPLPVLEALRVPVQGRLILLGDVQLEADLSGELASPRVEIRGTLPPMNAGGFALTGGDLRARWSDGGLQLETLALRSTAGSLQATGALRPGPWTVDGLQVTVRRFDLAALWPALYREPSPFRGTLEARLTASGPLGGPDAGAGQVAGAQLTLADLSYRGEPLAPMTVRLDYRNGTAEGGLQQADSRIAFRLRLDRNTLAGQFSARIAELKPLAALLRVRGASGRLQADGTVEGPWRAPRLQARLTGRQMRYAGFPADTVDAEVRIGAGSGPGVSAAGASGSAGRPGGGLVFDRLDLTGSLPAVDPGAPPFGLQGLSGGFRYRASLRGPLDGLAGSLTATLLQPGYGGVRFDGGSLAARLAGGRVILDSLQLRQGSLRVAAAADFDYRAMTGSVRADLAGGSPGRLTATFALPRDGALRVTAEGQGISLDPLHGLGVALPDMGGALTFSAAVHGARPLEATATWAIVDPRFRDVRMSAMQGRFVLQGGQLRVEELDLSGPGVRFQASASIGLDTRGGRPALSVDSPFSGQIHGENVDLRLLAPFLPPTAQAGGSFSGQIGWSGTLRSPNPTGTLSIVGGTLRLRPDAPLVEQAQMNASFRGTTLTLESLNAMVQGVPVSVRGTLQTPDFRQVRLDLSVALSSWGALDASGTVSAGQLALDGRVRSLNLQIVELFLPELKSLRGTLTGAVALRGTPAVPLVNGTAEAADLQYAIPGLPDPLSGGRLRLSFQGRQVTVQSLAAQLGKGMLSAAGSLSWGQGGLEASDLKVSLRGLALKQPGVYSASIRSAELRFFGKGEQYALEGDVEPGDFRLLLNFQPAAITTFLRTLARPSKPMPLFLAKARLNVRLRNADNLWMQNNLGQVRLAAALTVLGTPAQPAVAGRVTVQDGFVMFLDRRFSIVRGTADFEDARRMNPVIDLEARTQVKFFQQLKSIPFAVVLTLSGPLDTLQVGLNSDPPLSQSNIISLLALGTIRSETQGGLSEARSAGQILLERAGELASEQVSEYIGKGAKDLLGLDQFSVTGNLFNLGRGENNPELTASKKLNDQLELSYSTNLGPFDKHNLQLDYQLNDNLSLEGKVNQAGEAELRLKLGIKLK